MYLRGVYKDRFILLCSGSQPVVRECLQSFGAEYYVFQCDIQNLKIKIHRTVILPVVLSVV